MANLIAQSDLEWLAEKGPGITDLVVPASNLDDGGDSVIVIPGISATQIFQAIRNTVAVEVGIAGLIEIPEKMHLPTIIDPIMVRIEEAETDLLRDVQVDSRKCPSAAIAPSPDSAIGFHGQRVLITRGDGDYICQPDHLDRTLMGSCGSIAKLTEKIVTPGPDGPVI